MKNNVLFPFERNRYYVGKLLTSADFEAEQLYMNNKRRFLNCVMYGSGVVCGLNVVNLDDLSILLESGVAIDGAGREIVVDSTVVKRLSSLDGFENITEDKVRLYIRYKESEVHDVYSGDIGNSGKEYESNRIDEGYELYLKNAGKLEKETAVERELILKETILDNADYTVYITIPYAISKGQHVKLVVNICKNSDENRDLCLKAKLQLPIFRNLQGKHELEIDVCETALTKNQCICKEYWITTDCSDVRETNILGRKEDMQISVGGYEIEPANSIDFTVRLSDQAPSDLAASEVGKINLESNRKEYDQDGVCIAELQILKTETSCLIGNIKEEGIKRYIMTPGKTKERNRFMEYFLDRFQPERATSENVTIENMGIKGLEIPTFMTSGRLEIPLNVNTKKGDVCFSEEIMHGLGKGNVYVAVGMEYLSDEAYGKNNKRNTIYGNPDLFDFYECMQVETAVRVLNDKGSFQVAAKLLGEQKSIVLQLNWVAIKFSSLKDTDELQEEDDRSISPETPTVRLKAKESYYFNINFHNLQPCRLSYELTESGSGEIGADGLYTAPAKEGVYEIRIYCTDMPKISTYAYAVVSK